MSTIIQAADTQTHFNVIRELFLEYANWLQDDFCTASMTEELATLPGDYAPPDGRLYLAARSDIAPFEEIHWLGCIALRRLDESAGEIKRLYVRPAARGLGLGRMLVEIVIRQARVIGYQSLRLDTLPKLTAAIQIYESFGFRKIKAPEGAPDIGEVYFELQL